MVIRIRISQNTNSQTSLGLINLPQVQVRGDKAAGLGGCNTEETKQGIWNSLANRGSLGHRPCLVEAGISAGLLLLEGRADSKARLKAGHPFAFWGPWGKMVAQRAWR